MTAHEYDKIIEQIGELKGIAQSTENNVKRINGSIVDLYKKVNFNENKIISLEKDNGRLFEVKSRLVAEMNQFLEKQEKKTDWWSNIKSNIFIYIITLVIGALLAIYMPSLFQ